MFECRSIAWMVLSLTAERVPTLPLGPQVVPLVIVNDFLIELTFGLAADVATIQGGQDHAYRVLSALALIRSTLQTLALNNDSPKHDSQLSQSSKP
jgi:hypothetical protein